MPTTPRLSHMSRQFVIIGERRSGSTFLYHCLSRHPEIALYPQPDFDYFYDHGLSSLEWVDGRENAERWERTHRPDDYAALFSRMRTTSAAFGHKGANLLFWRAAHHRMARYAPEARLIVVLRDPVSRAWSQYWNEVGKGREHMSFPEAIAAEQERTRQSDWARMNLAYVQRGYYEESLSHLYAHFPSEQVLVLTLEELKCDTPTSMARVFAFLGLDYSPQQYGDVPRNVGWTLLQRPWVARARVQWIERTYGKLVDKGVKLFMDRYRGRAVAAALKFPFRRAALDQSIPPSAAAHLHEHYRPHVARLQAILKRSLSEWTIG